MLASILLDVGSLVKSTLKRNVISI